MLFADLANVSDLLGREDLAGGIVRGVEDEKTGAWRDGAPELVQVDLPLRRPDVAAGRVGRGSERQDLWNSTVIGAALVFSSVKRTRGRKRGKTDMLGKNWSKTILVPPFLSYEFQKDQRSGHTRLEEDDFVARSAKGAEKATGRGTFS